MTVTAPPRPRRDLHLLYAAATASKLGMEVGSFALPLVAVIALDASPGQVGLVATLTTAAFLLIGLPAGVWVDRARRRGIMVAADLVRAALYASIPIAWGLDLLTMEQLYLVALLAGFATVFFDVSALSYLPHVAGRDRLMSANSVLGSIDSVVHIGGQSAAGFLVQLASAPVAMVTTAAGYVLSGGFLAGIRRREPAVATSGAPREPLVRSIAAGVRFVAGHRILRSVAVAGAMTNLGMQLVLVMLPVLVVQRLGLSPGVLGLFFAVGGVSGLIGAATATRVVGRLGAGRALWLLGVLVGPAGLLVPLIGPGPWLWVAGAGWVVLVFKISVDNVVLVSFRQRVTPDHLLGRQNATMRFLLTGSVAIGAGLSGLIGATAGPRAALWAGAGVLALVWVPLYLSPLRRLRSLTDATS
ncbi:MFS transporter [Jiangella alkaliphila]|uniref:Predicted arabinose efflux permease, MFS family n=1 Tax=Jiangella alkaliphila TaxID=419479 RepID=A0A1H2IQG2_9ACTN|nr:MFS transporter [Jiangella alkaliphila]SDU46261.1 Predicted arabinose efflux permease, MFS family [Jiangella alkaliphila]